MKVRRGLLAAFAVLAALVVAPSAQAAFPSDLYGGAAPCSTLTSNGNIRLCTGVTTTWDHETKINVNVFLPPATGGTEGPYPTIGDFHGWGSAKQGLNEVPAATKTTPGGFIEGKDPRIQHWAEEGYAVFSMSDRGWGYSCGAFDEQKIKGEAPCKNGYNHLMDDRYEVRDAQYLISELADEGVVEPTKIGATGASYGGGLSIALAALRNREMMPSGALVPWESPGHLKMEIAAAVPQWPWTDIAYALAPNGRNLDYVTESSYRGPEGKFPVGVWKASWNEYLYGAGLVLSNYNETNPEADIPGWIQRLKAGDPYTDSSINGIIKLLTTFHSAYYINSSVEPAPLLIQSGWNDDLFPVDEALRFYQRTRSQYPSDPISLYLADIGHSRSQNKAADVAAFNLRLEAWFAHYLKGEGVAPTSSVEATTTTCPGTAPSGGPLKANDWSALAPGEVRLQTSGSQTITHRSAEEERTAVENEEFNEKSAYFDPIIGPKIGKNVCSSAQDTEEPGSANYELGAAPAGGYTLMGSPTIIAKVESPSPNSEIAARLVDVAPGGTETLIARGLYRPEGGNQEIVFQLHPQAYHFAAGDKPKLELLSSDVPYGRYSNLQANVTLSDLELRLPVTEEPGSLGGLVQKPAPKIIPAGYTLAAEYEADQNPGGGNGGGGETTPKPPAPAPVTKIGAGNLAGRLSATRKVLIVPLSCTDVGACSGKVSFSVPRSGKKGGTTVAKGSYSLAAGKNSSARLPLTKAGRNLVKSILAEPHPSKTLSGLFKLNDSSRSTSLTSRRAAQLPRSN
jgi:predicted acyl esterase